MMTRFSRGLLIGCLALTLPLLSPAFSEETDQLKQFKTKYSTESTRLILKKFLNKLEATQSEIAAYKAALEKPDTLTSITKKEPTASFKEGSSLQQVASTDIYSTNKSGFVDTQGTIVTTADFTIVSAFSEGLAVIQGTSGNNTDKFGYVNTNGNIVIFPEYDAASAFSEGFARVKEDNQWHFINTKGDYAFPMTFKQADDFTNGLAPVAVNDLIGYINTKGKLVIEPQFKAAENFHNNLAKVWSGGLDENGRRE